LSLPVLGGKPLSGQEAHSAAPTTAQEVSSITPTAVQEASGATPTAVKEAHGVSSALAQQVRDVSLEDPPQHAKKALTIDDYEVEEVEEEEGEGDKDLLLSRSGRPVRQAAKRALGLDSDCGSPPLEAHLRIPYKDKGKAKEATGYPQKKSKRSVK
jgi:hypothetical protein